MADYLLINPCHVEFHLRYCQDRIISTSAVTRKLGVKYNDLLMFFLVYKLICTLEVKNKLSSAQF